MKTPKIISFVKKYCIFLKISENKILDEKILELLIYLLLIQNKNYTPFNSIY